MNPALEAYLASVHTDAATQPVKSLWDELLVSVLPPSPPAAAAAAKLQARARGARARRQSAAAREAAATELARRATEAKSESMTKALLAAEQKAKLEAQAQEWLDARSASAGVAAAAAAAAPAQPLATDVMVQLTTQTTAAGKAAAMRAALERSALQQAAAELAAEQAAEQAAADKAAKAAQRVAAVRARLAHALERAAAAGLTLVDAEPMTPPLRRTAAETSRLAGPVVVEPETVVLDAENKERRRWMAKEGALDVWLTPLQSRSLEAKLADDGEGSRVGSAAERRRLSWVAAMAGRAALLLAMVAASLAQAALLEPRATLPWLQSWHGLAQSEVRGVV